MYLFFLVLEFFLNRILNRFWIFVPATPATHALFVGIQWVGLISMLALYVYTFLLPGRKLPRAHVGPSERCRDGRGVDTVLVFIRREISRHLRGAEGAEPLSAANGLVYYVPGVVVWKGRRIAATDLLLSTYGVVAGRRVVGDVELNSPCEPEYVLLPTMQQGGDPHRGAKI